MRTDILTFAAALLLTSVPAAAAVLTGSVRTQGAQPILAPTSLSSVVTLRFYVPDGAKVKKGQPIVRIDASQASSTLDSLRNQIAMAKATNAKKLAALELKVIDAKLALVDAVAARDTAKVDADIPKEVITGLQYDQYQGTYKSDKRAATLKQHDLTAAEAAVARQRKTGALTIEQLDTKLDFSEGQVEAATVLAKRDGTVVHGFNNLQISFGGGGQTQSGGRYRQGSTTFTGTEIGKVVGVGSRHTVVAWALQPDRRGLKVGQSVRVHFDALPKADIAGHVTAISAATEQRREWGDGHYYRVDVALDDVAQKLPLLPGMSARIQTDVKADHKPTPGQHLAATTLHVTGEVIAQKTWSAIPPRVPGLWQMTIAQMAPGGAEVKKGQPLVTFAASSLAQKLPATMSQLAEAKRALDQLRMQMADDKKTVQVTLAQAEGDAIKAKRKANQPKEYIAGVEYKKLVIDRRRTQKRLALTRQEVTVAAASRKAQLAEAEATKAQYQREVARMRASMATLTIRAPRTGLFLHTVKSDGTQINTGEQVFFGAVVGTMPDMDTLAVNASLPERDLTRVHVGQAVQVILSGGGSRTFDGHIAAVGHNVHSQSNAEPVPVVDLVVKFDGHPTGLKPGRSVSVDIPVKAEVAS